MNAWIVRLLGGAACTAGALAFGAGIAQAQEQHHVPADLASVVSTVTGGHHHFATSVGNHVAVKGKSVKAGNTAVQLGGSTHQARAIGTARIGSQQQGSVRTVPATNRRPARQDTLITTATVTPRPAEPAASAAKSDARADALRNNAVACARINSGGCGTGDTAGTGGSDPADTTDRAPRRSTALSNTELLVLDTPASSCVRVNAGDCGSVSGGSAPADNPALPVAGGDMTASGQTFADGAACVRINGGGCGSTSGSGTGPVDPGSVARSGPVRADSAGNLGDGFGRNGHTLPWRDGARNGSAALTADAGADGQDPSLAHTGAGAGLLPALLIGLLALLGSVPLLRRRRNG